MQKKNYRIEIVPQIVTRLFLTYNVFCIKKYMYFFSDDCQEYFTSPLQLSNQEWHFHNLIPSVDGMIPLEGICHLKV